MQLVSGIYVFTPPYSYNSNNFISSKRLLYFDCLTAESSRLCLALGDNTFSLNLCHELLFHRILLLFSGTFHGSFRSLDASTVLPVLVISTEDPVPPPERGREVVGESHVVEIVVLGARPEGDNVVQRPREV